MSREVEAEVAASMPTVRENIPRPRAVDDPDWGKSNYKPSNVTVGRRAMLLDLPDPAVISVDPLASPGDADSSQVTQAIDPEAARRFEVLRRVPSPLDDPSGPMPAVQASESEEPAAPVQADEQAQAAVQQLRPYNKERGRSIGSRAPKKNAKRKMRFGRKRPEQEQQVESMSDWLGLDEDYDAKKDGRQIGSWDNFADDDKKGKWKGGATLRSGLRDDEDGLDDVEFETDQLGVPNFDSLDLQGDPMDEEQQQEEQQLDDEELEPQVIEVDPETMEELREAVLRLGDDDLIAHDIWFVGLGASTLDHAGIKAFLREHRRDIRGSFLVNLDSVGAGKLTLLTREGTGDKKRSDRRMGRMITNIADALHIDLDHADYSWDETDATPAMQQRVRIGTLMGMSDDGVAAHSRTPFDEPEYLDDQQIANVADIVAELIRRA